MFEFEPDEYIFTKLAHYFKRRKRSKEESLLHTVKLSDIKPRLVIFARAITGKPIEIYEAEREGGYKNNNFFLPIKFSEFSTIEENTSFYLFRVLYLSIQKNLNLNWNDTTEHTLESSQEQANKVAEKILKVLFEEFPVTKKYHQKFLQHYKNKRVVDYSFVYGKWMRNTPEGGVR